MDVVPLVDEGLGNSAYVVDLGILDIRQRSEFTTGHVPGAHHVELGALTQPTDRIPDTPLFVHCGHGERAMSAASLLRRAGHEDVAVLAGGPGELAELESGAGA